MCQVVDSSHDCDGIRNDDKESILSVWMELFKKKRNWRRKNGWYNRSDRIEKIKMMDIQL